jgi:hypothetical protein
MSDISGVSGPQKLTSQLKVSLESTQKQPAVDSAIEMQKIKQFEIEMKQLNDAFTLMQEIRASLESALRDLG